MNEISIFSEKIVLLVIEVSMNEATFLLKTRRYLPNSSRSDEGGKSEMLNMKDTEIKQWLILKKITNL